jgi:hypothetical protein
VAHQSGKPVAVIKDFRQHEKQQYDKPAEEKVAA